MPQGNETNSSCKLLSYNATPQGDSPVGLLPGHQNVLLVKETVDAAFHSAHGLANALFGLKALGIFPVRQEAHLQQNCWYIRGEQYVKASLAVGIPQNWS